VKTNAPAATTPPSAPQAAAPPSTWTPPQAAAAPARTRRNWKPAAYGVAAGGTVVGAGAYVGNRRELKKRYSAEGNRKKRLDRYAGAATATGIGLAGAAGYGGVKAVQMKSPTTAALAGAAGLGSLGSHLASQRIKSYKKGKGASYRPLARYRAE
jgi:hypothetical protein